MPSSESDAQAPRGVAGFRPLTVRRVQRDTRDSAIITLEPLLPFVHGQHLVVRASINGAEQRRTYSICAGSQDGVMRISVKRAPGGVFSNWLLDNIRAGDQLDCMGPEGEFHVPVDPGAAHHYAAFAAGSGITPVFSIIKTTLQAEPKSNFTLFFGNRASSTVMLREDLADLKDRFLHRFTLIHVLSREHQDIDLFNGRITGEKARELLARFAPLAELDTVFLCGPAGMIESVRPVLEGVRVKLEYFAPPDQAPVRRAQVVSEAADCDVTLLLDGAKYRYTLQGSNESVLEGAIRSGIDVRYSCKSGVCATCRAKLLAGQVDMDANYALEDYEVARGFVLTCQSYPASKAVMVDFDAQD
jgi:ring-1,2-phenylacetyl-CoA epoxidase subunit PaaE